jgi:hypothetical protein
VLSYRRRCWSVRDAAGEVEALLQRFREVTDVSSELLTMLGDRQDVIDDEASGHDP